MVKVMHHSGSRCYSHEMIDLWMKLWALKNLFHRGIGAEESKILTDGGTFNLFLDLLGPKTSKFKVLAGF